MVSENKPMSNSSTPSEKVKEISTDTHTLISFGDKEKKLLRYLYDNQKERFNIRAYSKLTKIPRPTVYDVLNRLIVKGFAYKPNGGDHKITQKGISYIDSLRYVDEDVETKRRECRPGKLSTHYIKYRLPIKDRKKFKDFRIKDLNPIDWRIHEIPYLKKYIVYFEDATVEINPNKIIIHIHDIITDNLDDAHFTSFKKAIHYAENLRQIGIVTDCMELSQAHYARVESHLSDFLHKIDNKYYLPLGDGTKFWIDHSNNKREDETDNALFRQRLDDTMLSLKDTKSTWKDMDASIIDLKMLKEIAYNQVMAFNSLIELEQIRQGVDIKKKEEEMKYQTKLSDKDNYFG